MYLTFITSPGTEPQRGDQLARGHRREPGLERGSPHRLPLRSPPKDQVTAVLTWGLTDTFRHPLLPRPASSGGGEDWEGSAIAASPGSEGPQRPPHFRGHP